MRDELLRGTMTFMGGITNASITDPFRDLPDEARQALLAHARATVLQRRGRAFQTGETAADVTFVQSGWLKLSACQPNGREVALGLVGPGSVACVSAACSGKPYCCTATAAQVPTHLLRVPRQTLEGLMAAHPELLRTVMAAVGCRARDGCTRVAEVATGRVDQRIARFLGRLAREAGVPRDGDQLFVPIALTRQDLADLCGTTVESAIRAMRRLQGAHLVTTEPGGFLVPSVEALTSVGDG